MSKPSTRQCRGCVVVALHGEVDVVAAAGVAKAIRAIAARRRKIIVDLADLEFIDCGGLRALVTAGGRVRAAGGDLLLAAPQPRVLQLLTLIGINDLFLVYPGVEEAAASAGRSRRGELPATVAAVRQGI